MLSIEEQRTVVRNNEAIMDVVIKAIEDNPRYDFNGGVGGMCSKLHVFDKESNTYYEIEINPVNYDNEEKPNE